MSKTTIKEVIGFTGVIGSLVFVGLQVRQGTLAARASAYQQMGTSVAEIWLSTAQDPERAMLTLKFFEDDAAVFSPAEEAVLINQSIAALRQLETTWRQVKLGLFGPEILQAFGPTEPGPAFSVNMGKLWPRIAPHMSPDFRAYLEGRISQR